MQQKSTVRQCIEEQLRQLVRAALAAKTAASRLERSAAFENVENDEFFEIFRTHTRATRPDLLLNKYSAPPLIWKLQMSHVIMAASIRRGAKRLPRAIGAAFPPKTMHMGPVATFCAPNILDAVGSVGRGSPLGGDWGPAGTGLPTGGDPDVGPRRRDEDSARHDYSKDMYPDSQRRASEDSAPEESEERDLRSASAREKLFSDKTEAPADAAHRDAGRGKRHSYWGVSVSDRQRPDGGE